MGRKLRLATALVLLALGSISTLAPPSALAAPKGAAYRDASWWPQINAARAANGLAAVRQQRLAPQRVAADYQRQAGRRSAVSPPRRAQRPAVQRADEGLRAQPGRYFGEHARGRLQRGAPTPCAPWLPQRPASRGPALVAAIAASASARRARPLERPAGVVRHRQLGRLIPQVRPAASPRARRRALASQGCRVRSPVHGVSMGDFHVKKIILPSGKAVEIVYFHQEPGAEAEATTTTHHRRGAPRARAVPRVRRRRSGLPDRLA